MRRVTNRRGDPYRSNEEIALTCNACQKQIGLCSAWHAHPALSAPGSARTAGFRAQSFQKLYCCAVCKTVLVRGRNTGWALAIAQGAAEVAR
jgi:hypothetical protein